MYDRKLSNPRPYGEPKSRLRHRIETLIGITGYRMAKYRSGWKEVLFVWFKILWRPHLLGILWFEVNPCSQAWPSHNSSNIGHALWFQHRDQCKLLEDTL